MNLFALTSVPAARIVRFPLTQGLQEDVRAVFAEQLAAFNNGIDTVVPFDGRYRPEEGELLAINNFDDIDGLGAAIANPLAVEQFDPQIHSLDSVKALFTGSNEDGIQRTLIQLFENRRLIATKGLAFFYSGNTFQKMSDAGLTMDTKLLAVLEGGTLKFQSFHFLRRVFDLSDYFNEATAEEVTAFASHEKLSVADIQTFTDTASAPIRKKITLIRQSGVLDNFTTQQIVAAAQTFNVVVQTSPDGRIVLPTNNTELRRLLRFLDEDYYESPLTQTHFVSNSKRVAD